MWREETPVFLVRLLLPTKKSKKNELPTKLCAIEFSFVRFRQTAFDCEMKPFFLARVGGLDYEILCQSMGMAFPLSSLCYDQRLRSSCENQKHAFCDRQRNRDAEVPLETIRAHVLYWVGPQQHNVHPDLASISIYLSGKGTHNDNRPPSLPSAFFSSV